MDIQQWSVLGSTISNGVSDTLNDSPINRIPNYFAAFVCVAEGKPFVIPKHISLPCVKSAESIVNTSYSQAEVYSSVSETPT